jgi:hypothetical protein
VIEHTTAKIGLEKNSRTEKTNSPKKSAKHDYQNDENHRQTDFIKQKCHIECALHAIDHDYAVVYTVYYHSVQLRYLKMKTVNEEERYESEENQRRVFKIITVYMLTENHFLSSFAALRYFLRKAFIFSPFGVTYAVQLV